ncbi:MAG TPA: hypothetical protein VHE78_04260 [Gemmatimonadaceae bacterium]|nr:hypothetical protein [Gemmatimonadaceae bacterium]
MMMDLTRRSGKPLAGLYATIVSLVVASAASAQPGPPATTSAPQKPTNTYWVYVGAESADKLYRLRFGPDGFAVEKSFEIGELPTEMEGPHGLIISRDGKYLYMTTGHGFPDGKLWKYELGPDTLVAPGLLLGNFPASLDVTPDGKYTFSANFNLHGDMVPSSQSVVYTPSMTEVARIVTCVMPHGSRLDPSGRFQYSGCMMDDELVEIDARVFRVSRRLSVAKGKEGPIPVEDEAHMLSMWIDGAKKVSKGQTADPAQVGYLAMGGARHEMAPQSCSPTWAQPSADGSKVFVACNKLDEILEVDVATWTISRRFKSGSGPYNLGVTPDGKLLLATLKKGAMFEVFDLATGASLAQLKNSSTIANGVAVSPDSRYAFVSSEGVGAAPGKVDVYDLRALAKVGTVDVGQQAGGIAFWKMEPAKQ